MIRSTIISPVPRVGRKLKSGLMVIPFLCWRTLLGFRREPGRESPSTKSIAARLVPTQVHSGGQGDAGWVAPALPGQQAYVLLQAACLSSEGRDGSAERVSNTGQVIAEEEQAQHQQHQQLTHTDSEHGIPHSCFRWDLFGGGVGATTPAMYPAMWIMKV